jgi:hypothetical protein
MRGQPGQHGQPGRECDIIGWWLAAPLAPAGPGTVSNQAAVETARERPAAHAAPPGPGIASQPDDAAASWGGVGLARGKSRTEAIRLLRRQLSDAAFSALRADERASDAAQSPRPAATRPAA